MYIFFKSNTLYLMNLNTKVLLLTIYCPFHNSLPFSCVPTLTPQNSRKYEPGAVWTSVCFCLVEAWLKNVWPGFFLLWRGKTTGHPLEMQLTSRKGFIRESAEKITAFFWKLKLYRGGEETNSTNGRITGAGGGYSKEPLEYSTILCMYIYVYS